HRYGLSHRPYAYGFHGHAPAELSLLAIGPARGRFFAPDEGWMKGKDPLMVLSYKFWQSRFGGEASAVGKTVLVNNRALFAFCFAVALLTGIAAGIIPALRTSHADLADTLKEGGRSGTGAENPAGAGAGGRVHAQVGCRVYERQPG